MNNKNMNGYVKICMAVFTFCATATSCNRDEVFEKEQYKNVFALVSGNGNVSAWTHDLRVPESSGYVSAAAGGSNPTVRDIAVSLVEDVSLIDAYNVTNFDVNTSKYIQPLAKRKYTIDSYGFVIPAGEVKTSIPVRIRPEGLSPDSSYFIALKVDTYSAYEVNPEKDYVLYQVRIRNWWASYGGSSYNQRGKLLEIGSAGQPTEIFGSKKLYPLTANTVRLLAGNELNDKAEADIFERYSLTLTIDDDNRVTVSSYKKLNVTQLDGDPDFPNIVKVESDRFKTYKTFLLYYSYKASNGRNYDMKEELRFEFKEDPDDPRFLNK